MSVTQSAEAPFPLWSALAPLQAAIAVHQRTTSRNLRLFMPSTLPSRAARGLAACLSLHNTTVNGSPADSAILFALHRHPASLSCLLAYLDSVAGYFCARLSKTSPNEPCIAQPRAPRALYPYTILECASVSLCLFCPHRHRWRLLPWLGNEFAFQLYRACCPRCP